MKAKTAELWAKQDRHKGDRWRMFRAVASATRASKVLYPGSYVDVSASFVFPWVTYLDADKRANAFFADVDGVREIVAAHKSAIDADAEFAFIHADYTAPIALPEQSVDLLVSLYAGFISEHCTNHLRIGGTLLVNGSHGDAAMASIDPRYKLLGVVVTEGDDYRIEQSELDEYLVPKKPQAISVEGLHQSGKGIQYTRSPFAYLFERVA